MPTDTDNLVDKFTDYFLDKIPIIQNGLAEMEVYKPMNSYTGKKTKSSKHSQKMNLSW